MFLGTFANRVSETAKTHHGATEHRENQNLNRKQDVSFDPEELGKQYQL